MPRAILHAAHSILLVTDLQSKFLEVIDQQDRVLAHSLFLARIASLLGVPVIATEQNPDRLGATAPELLPTLSRPPIPKMSFASTGEPAFREVLESSHRRQVIIVGVETHICVSLTANQLLEDGYQVVVCPDAVSSRTVERHKLGMERIRDAGAVPAHTESVAYDWLGSASHPKFREALAIVKQQG